MQKALNSQKIIDKKRNNMLIRRNLYKVGKNLGIEKIISLSPWDHECCKAECRADCRCDCCYGECSNYPPQYHLAYSELDKDVLYKIEKVFRPLEKAIICENPKCNYFKRLKNLDCEECIIQDTKKKFFKCTPMHRTCSLTCYRELKKIDMH